MKHVCTLCTSMLLTFTGVGLFAHPVMGATLRVLTYNIHHSEGRDSVSDLERIAAVINSTSPDIVALQELDQGNSRSGSDVFQLDRLAELTGLQGFFGKTLNFRGGEYGNGVLISQAITITRTVNHSLPSPAGGEARGMIEVGLSLDDVDATEELVFFATHFHHTGDDTNRFAQAGYVNDLVAASTSPAILAGDLNADPTSRTMNLIYEEWTNTSGPISQIDYALYRGDDQWNVLQEGAFVVNLTTAVASDHFPLLAVVEIVPEPTSLAFLSISSLGMAYRRRRKRQPASYAAANLNNTTAFLRGRLFSFAGS